MERKFKTILFTGAGVFIFCEGKIRVSQYFKVFLGNCIENKAFETLGCFKLI